MENNVHSDIGEEEIVTLPRRKSLVRFSATDDAERPRAITRIPTRAELTTLTRMAKRPAVDIEFQDLTYQAGHQRILKGINGIFKSGELTAIMGPSGAGKSTLMNILVGYTSAGVSGTIMTNGHPRQMKLFNKLSSYIMQEDMIQPSLTVREAMMVAAHLKLGDELSTEDKELAVVEILDTLGLSQCAETSTERLSGGQRKRVSVALELVNNPPVIFLDEPTTGLDIVSINNCIQLLKDLSRQGRTIVCTIHQPSATMFHMFDVVYMLARGQCVYQGSSHQLVPFLSHCGLQCPPTYNPADYIFEVLSLDVINLMTSEIQNGRIIKLDPQTASEPPRSKLLTQDTTLGSDYPSGRKETMAVMPHVYGVEPETLQFPTSFYQQFCIILSRLLLQKRRNRTALWLQIIHHVFSGLIIGIIFWGIGNNASRPFENFKFCLCVVVFMMYTYVMSPILIMPTEMKLLRREYFNRWYGIKAYYMARTAVTIPITFTLCMLFNVLVYTMSDQPMELARFLWFCSITTILAFVSEGMGMLIGIIFNCTNGAVVGPSVMAPILMLSYLGMGYGVRTVPFQEILMRLSFLRLSLVGVVTTLYYHDRAPMECINDVHPYCHYQDPSLLVRDLGMGGEVTLYNLLGMFGYLLLFRLAAYFAMRFRLTTQLRSHIITYVHKIIKQR
ncbi:ATP-binding cassette subfamily G member 4-like isoform X2 [Macrosteles quadrilineatus]|uniref:ATP-binding cassette subfamily G member 4-like isoform X2 n=1 Tax=Macrosteles quadrilineatus TaxID=74068 RepID=UPI0023E18BB7|nr:ATP-binding cassette subfamily G member 4-like isoform X2 [Macrosteles quadrilineatus]